MDKNAEPELTSDDIFNQWKDSLSGPLLQSTDSSVIPYNGILYNVSGSKDDPPKVKQCPRCSWRELLLTSIPSMKDATCYVENSDSPKDKSHYSEKGDFLGGHMTKIKNGHVENGGDTYLMPLCSWDNNTARNGEPFQVTNREILILRGYMQSELYVTFAARMPAVGENNFGLIYFDESEGIWRHEDISTERANKLSPKNNEDPNKFVLIEKSNDVRTECTVQDMHLD